MSDDDWLAARFEANRSRLRAVAYRMLGSTAEAEDAVQETWIRLSRSDAGEIDNLDGWLTTVVARVCLNALQSRKTRREDPFGPFVPEPPSSAASADSGADPEREALLADSIGPALLVVLDTLAPAERLAFVLHDLFAVPFDEIAAIVGRSPDATRQLASRARRRVQGAAAPAAPDADRARQRAVVDAFLAAARGGDFEALLAVLDPDVELHVDRAAGRGEPRVVRGAEDVVRQALLYSARAGATRPALIDGAVGLAWAPGGRAELLFVTTIVDDRIVHIELVGDPERVEALDVVLLD